MSYRYTVSSLNVLYLAASLFAYYGRASPPYKAPGTHPTPSQSDPTLLGTSPNSLLCYIRCELEFQYHLSHMKYIDTLILIVYYTFYCSQVVLYNTSSPHYCSLIKLVCTCLRLTLQFSYRSY